MYLENIQKWAFGGQRRVSWAGHRCYIHLHLWRHWMAAAMGRKGPIWQDEHFHSAALSRLDNLGILHVITACASLDPQASIDVGVLSAAHWDPAAEVVKFLWSSSFHFFFPRDPVAALEVVVLHVTSVGVGLSRQWTTTAISKQVASAPVRRVIDGKFFPGEEFCSSAPLFGASATRADIYCKHHFSS
ncbi:hypothetical protein BDBG_17371 [Blastomyces gilchristii SLH14081]|uniref:Uncharacterized protein n=1 Tax=Blastomyces gilchristii (strain SLH14081) TaxID=559298 RepID=A0A179UTY5_BLAGS|nr:uncharacterized protein BDBG_17371 [Blastomyces gilchristii SLH14081]OAT10527.1 hypothetical protein BDBG_17371 [Blastomyces gilchristii SLH14081]